LPYEASGHPIEIASGISQHLVATFVQNILEPVELVAVVEVGIGPQAENLALSAALTLPKLLDLIG